MNVEDIFEEFCSKYHIKNHPTKRHVAKITTPFSMLNGDPISFVAEIVDDTTIRLHDDLMIFRYFDNSYYDPSGNALDIATTVLASYGMKNDEYRISKTINIQIEDIDESIADYITGLVRLSDLTYLKRESIKKEFAEIVFEFIKNNVKSKYHYYDEGIMSLQGSESYPVDMALSNDNKKWVAIFLLSTHSRISEATISTMYYKYYKGYDVYTMSIFDNIDSLLSPMKTKRLINHTDKPIIDFTDESKEIILRTINHQIGQ